MRQERIRSLSADGTKEEGRKLMRTVYPKNARPVAACALALLVSFRAAAQEYKVLVPQLSPSTTDIYRKAATAIVQAGGAKASIEVVPFARAIHLIEAKQADMLCFEIENPDPAKVAKLTVDYSTANLFQMVFVLYANKDRPVDASELKRGNPKHLVVETDLAHVEYFPFQATGSSDIDSSLKKLAVGRIDAFVFAQPSTDAALKRLGLKNVTRQLYGLYNAKIILQKGARGGTLDQTLTRGLEKMKKDGSYQQLMGQYLEGASKFIEWQP
jgi:polar amino acid transport system substrate-binding protein